MTSIKSANVGLRSSYSVFTITFSNDAGLCRFLGSIAKAIRSANLSWWTGLVGIVFCPVPVVSVRFLFNTTVVASLDPDELL